MIKHYKTSNGTSEIVVANEACKRTILFYEERFFIYVPTTVFALSLDSAPSLNSQRINYFRMAFSSRLPKNLNESSELFLPYLPNIWRDYLDICLGEQNNYRLRQRKYPETIEQMEEFIKCAIDYFWNSKFNSGGCRYGALGVYNSSSREGNLANTGLFFRKLDRKTRRGWVPKKADLHFWGNFSGLISERP